MVSGTVLPLLTLPIPVYLPLLSHVLGEADGSLYPSEPLGCGIPDEGSVWAFLLSGQGMNLGSSTRETLR